MMKHILPRDSMKMHKIYCKNFWDQHRNRKENYRRSVSRQGKEKCLQSLRDMGNIYLHYNSSHDRKHFDEVKSKKKYQFSICFACGGGAEIRHHIIWLKHGGRNQKNNIVGLCKKCHAEIHDWLK